MAIFLFFLAGLSLDHSAGERFFSEVTPPLSAMAQEASLSRFAILWHKKSIPVYPYTKLENSFGFSFLFSRLIKNFNLGGGYSHYFETKRISAQNFFHLNFDRRLFAKPELAIGLRYGMSLSSSFFLKGDPFYGYRLNSFHSFGLALSLAYPWKRFRPYLTTGFSISYRKGEFVEDIHQRKASYSQSSLLPNLGFGFSLFRFSLHLELGRGLNFSFGFNL